MQPISSDDESAWDQIAPHLNDALNQLKEPERNVILLRFLERKSIAQIGSVLGTSESATKMRISRALEQLRGIFRTRVIALPAALLLSALATHAAPAAPSGLVAAITTSALLKATTTSLLTKGTLLLMTASKSKIAIAAIAILLLCSSTTAWLTYQYAKHRNAAAAKAANSRPAEVELAFTPGPESAEPLPVYVPEGGGTLRIIISDGDVITTNGVNSLTLVNGKGTNTI